MMKGEVKPPLAIGYFGSAEFVAAAAAGGKRNWLP